MELMKHKLADTTLALSKGGKHSECGHRILVSKRVVFVKGRRKGDSLLGRSVLITWTYLTVSVGVAPLHGQTHALPAHNTTTHVLGSRGAV